MKLVVASFSSETSLIAALPYLHEAKLGNLVTYTPTMLRGEPHSPIIPWIVLVAGLLGAFGGFGMEVYANVISYPLDIGGRPAFSWPAFVPIAFEIAVLAAIVGGFFGFLVINRLPKLWLPVDEADLLRRATQDRWCVSIETEVPHRAHDLLVSLSADAIEEVPA
jgi:hypothetical protein